MANKFIFSFLFRIILDAGYFMPSGVFYYNIGTILMYAVLVSYRLTKLL